jgi:hypothetical protein
MSNLRQQLYSEIFIKLPILAKKQKWAVTADHCIGRIIYDSVMGCKWSKVVKSSFYKNAELSKIKEAILVCDRLKVEGKELADKLNSESLKYRKQLNTSKINKKQNK